MFKLLKSKDCLDNIEQLFPYFEIEKSNTRTEAFYNKQLMLLKDNSKTNLAQITFLLACFFSGLCHANANLSADAHNPTERAFVVNMQNNVRLCRQLLERFLTKSLGDATFYNRHSNKVHNMDSFRLRNLMTSKINTEIDAYVMVHKIHKVCTKYQGKIRPSTTVKKKGYNKITFNHEYFFYDKISSTATSRDKSNMRKLLLIKKELTDKESIKMISQTENKTFKSFVKNVIKTVFGITCLFGASFWNKRVVGEFTGDLINLASMAEAQPK